VTLPLPVHRLDRHQIRGTVRFLHQAFALRLEAYRRAPELTKFRLQIETLEDVLPGARKFVRPGAGDVKDIDMWLLRPPLKEAQDD